MSHHPGHGDNRIRLREGGPDRCTTCGHRLPSADGTPPGESRWKPPWTWPGEILGRYVAQRRAT